MYLYNGQFRFLFGRILGEIMSEVKHLKLQWLLDYEYQSSTILYLTILASLFTIILKPVTTPNLTMLICPNNFHQTKRTTLYSPVLAPTKFISGINSFLGPINVRQEDKIIHS